MMSNLMRNLMDPLEVWGALHWLMILAFLQYFILQKTQRRWQSLRLVLLAPVCWALYSIVGGVLLLVFCAFLIILLLVVLLQMDVLTLLSMTVEIAAMMFTSEGVLCALARIALCAAGWGLGWAVHLLKTTKGRPADEKTTPAL